MTPKTVYFTEGGILAFEDLPPAIMNQFLAQFILNEFGFCDRDLIDPLREYSMECLGRYARVAVAQSTVFWVNNVMRMIDKISVMYHMTTPIKEVDWDEKLMGESDFNLMDIINEIGMTLKNMGQRVALCALILFADLNMTPSLPCLQLLKQDVESIFKLGRSIDLAMTVSFLIKNFKQQLVANFLLLHKFLQPSGLVSFNQTSFPIYVLQQESSKQCKRSYEEIESDFSRSSCEEDDD